MNGPRIVLRFSRNCKFVGSSREFRGPIVRIGRRTENDLVFDPKRDLLVSGHHAEIRHVEGRTLVVDLGSKNGTFVNGERIRAPMPLMPGDRIELGPEGPEFSVEVMPETEDTILPESAPAMRSSRRMSQEDATPPPSSMFGVAPIRTPSPRNGPANVASPPRSKKKLTQLLVAVALLAAAAVGTRSMLSRKDPSGPARDSMDFQTIFAQNGRSVYAVILRENHGAAVIDRTIGTAFSASASKLATNAHIAQLYFELGSGQSLLARSNSVPPRDLRIVGAELHPGFHAFDQLIGRYVPFDVQQDGFVCSIAQRKAAIGDAESIVPGRPLISPCDVAVFSIDPADATQQEPPLRLAQMPRFADLASGEPVAYIGFPGEGLARAGSDVDSPAAFNRTGTLSKTTDCVLSVPKTLADAIQLAFNLDISGGASGSPVFDSRGDVIGLVAAGDFYFDPTGSRVPIGGSCYGPRIDLLSELLDGKAAAIQETRGKAFEISVAQMFARGAARASLIAENAAQALLQGEVTVVDDWQYALLEPSKPGEPVATGPFAIRAERAGRHIVCAVATERPIAISIGVTLAGQEERRVALPMIAPYVAVADLGDLAQNAESTLRAIANDPRGAAGSDVAFFVLRAAAKE